jgi:hypothetical protein
MVLMSRVLKIQVNLMLHELMQLNLKLLVGTAMKLN